MVYLRYFINGIYVKKSLGIRLEKSEWDAKRQEAKGKNAPRINNRLRYEKQRVDELMLKYEGQLNYKVLEGFLNGSGDKGKTLVAYVREVNENAYRTGRNGYRIYYQTKAHTDVLERWLEREGNKDITLEEFNVGMLDKYIAYYCGERGCTNPESVNKAIIPIRKTFEYASRCGDIESSKAFPLVSHPLLPLKGRTYTGETATKKVKYLTFKQLEEYDAYVPETEAQRKVKDLYFFSYYSCGLRVSDLVTLEWNHIDFEAGRINKVQFKTKNKGKLPPVVSEKGIAILERWKENGWGGERFVFGYFPDDYVFSKENEAETTRRLSTCVKTIDDRLKRTGAKLGLPFRLSIHTARHTFCVHSLNCGVSLLIVSRLMGHSSTKVTENAYADFLKETVDEEIAKLSEIY